MPGWPAPGPALGRGTEMRWFLFVVLAAVSWTARLLGVGVVEDPAGSALISLSCLIVGGVLAGELAARWRLPRITGYLVLGLLAGPYALGIELEPILEGGRQVGFFGVFHVDGRIVVETDQGFAAWSGEKWQACDAITPPRWPALPGERSPDRPDCHPGNRNPRRGRARPARHR